MLPLYHEHEVLCYMVGKGDCRYRGYLHSMLIIHTLKWLVVKNLGFDNLSQWWFRILSKIPCPNRNLVGQWPGKSSVCIYCSIICPRLPWLMTAAGQFISMLREIAPGLGTLEGIWRRDIFIEK